MKKKLSLNQLKVQSFVTSLENADKVKSGTALTDLLIGCGGEDPLTQRGCGHTDTTPECQSNPCTDTRVVTNRCRLNTEVCGLSADPRDCIL